MKTFVISNNNHQVVNRVNADEVKIEDGLLVFYRGNSVVATFSAYNYYSTVAESSITQENTKSLLLG